MRPLHSRPLRLALTTSMLAAMMVSAIQLAPQLAAHAGSHSDIVGPAGSEDFGNTGIVLANGNFVIGDPLYDSPSAANVGAVYLYDGTTHQLISTLTGATAGDEIGLGGVHEVGDSNVVVL